jgi:hypothetical protein
VTEVLASHAFASWFAALPELDAERITRAVSLLEAAGDALGPPHARRLGERWPAVDARLSCSLHVLTVSDSTLEVLYTLEGPGRAVLLHGYDVAEIPTRGVRSLAAPAQALVASAAYTDYRAQRAREA